MICNIVKNFKYCNIIEASPERLQKRLLRFINGKCPSQKIPEPDMFIPPMRFSSELS